MGKQSGIIESGGIVERKAFGILTVIGGERLFLPFYHLNTASLLLMFFPTVAANSFPRIVYFFISSL